MTNTLARILALRKSAATTAQGIARRRYNLEFLAVLVVFGGFLAISRFIADANPETTWRYAVAALPLVPAAYLVAAEQRAARRRFRYRFVAALAVYVGLVYLADFIVDANPEAHWRYAVALLPVLPVAFCVVDSIRYHNQLLDELHQRIQLEAVAFAFFGTVVITFGYGLLELAGLPSIGWAWAWVLMGALWLIGDWLVRRRRL